VADPSVSIGWKIYVKYNKTEVRNITSGLSGEILDRFKYTALLCGNIPNVIAAGGCATYIYEVYDSVASTFQSASVADQCLEMQYLIPNGYLVGWKGYNC
jgi:hypothetical protein